MSVKPDHSGVIRKYVSITFADIAGYTALIDLDADKAFEILPKNRAFYQELSQKYNRKLLKEIGDGMLLNFNLPSCVVRCAIEKQKISSQRNI